VANVDRVERIEGALQTPDGYWRVEIIRSGRDRWYRVRHAQTVVAAKASITTVERILGPAFGMLIEADAA
jgi:hypothetical protein